MILIIMFTSIVFTDFPASVLFSHIEVQRCN